MITIFVNIFFIYLQTFPPNLKILLWLIEQVVKSSRTIATSMTSSTRRDVTNIYATEKQTEKAKFFHLEPTIFNFSHMTLCYLYNTRVIATLSFSAYFRNLINGFTNYEYWWNSFSNRTKNFPCYKCNPMNFCTMCF